MKNSMLQVMIMAIVSLIFIPIAYFLPIRVKPKTKVIWAVTAVMAAFATYGLSMVIGVGLALLLVLLLIICISYFLWKKGVGTELFQMSNGEEESSENLTSMSPSSVNASHIAYPKESAQQPEEIKQESMEEIEESLMVDVTLDDLPKHEELTLKDEENKVEEMETVMEDLSTQQEPILDTKGEEEHATEEPKEMIEEFQTELLASKQQEILLPMEQENIIEEENDPQLEELPKIDDLDPDPQLEQWLYNRTTEPESLEQEKEDQGNTIMDRTDEYIAEREKLFDQLVDSEEVAKNRREDADVKELDAEELKEGFTELLEKIKEEEIESLAENVSTEEMVKQEGNIKQDQENDDLEDVLQELDNGSLDGKPEDVLEEHKESSVPSIEAVEEDWSSIEEIDASEQSNEETSEEMSLHHSMLDASLEVAAATEMEISPPHDQNENVKQLQDDQLIALNDVVEEEHMSETPLEPIDVEPNPEANVETLPIEEEPNPEANVETSPIDVELSPEANVETSPLEEEPNPEANVETSLIEEEPNSEANAETSPLEEEPDPEANTKTSPIVEEVIPLVVEQLQLLKQMKSDHDVEEMIKECLHPQLKNHEYFVLATFYLEYLKEQGRLEECQHMLEQMEQRFFTQHP